ncbi:MAG: molecular chaperone HtpG [Oscillospiraceae bacterium]|nr:molecular chaperone HtpG [Oscillospiraceae bacterium]
MSKQTEKGGISVQTEHIFPIIKKWLYSEKEIFLREIVSNACDAITKMKRLISLGEIRGVEDNFRVTVRLDKEEGTITVSDNGIGMTEEEVKNYICQIALSGALDFIQKYEGENGDSAPGIIGHFGLGFYSSFMVSESVDVITRSFNGEPAVKWECDDSGEYEMTPDYDRPERGTDVVMHIMDDEKEFLESAKIKEILQKYCAFMPVEIYFGDGHECKHDHKDDEDHECECSKPINDTHPLWQKPASECTDEEYKEFYNKVFHDYKEPLFHIHLSADYPLNFKGILYFPRINHEYESLEGQVKLYYNQVFVADNIKEVIPEYLLMLKGVLDCPELPLNVSRSYLQTNGYVTKISAHIIKKVADKLNSLFNTERERYEKLWNDIKLFVAYACIRDKKFYDRVKESILLQLTDGRYVTLSEYGSETVYYTTDKIVQAQYIAMYNAQGIDVAVLDKYIDTQFISTIEMENKIKFKRCDSDIADALKADGEVYDNKDLTDLFVKISGNDKLTVKYENLKDESVPCIVNIAEESRRFGDMIKMYRMEDMHAPIESTLIVNPGNKIIRKLGDNLDENIAKQVYTLALLSQRQLTADELKSFLSDSYILLEQL